MSRSSNFNPIDDDDMLEMQWERKLISRGGARKSSNDHDNKPNMNSPSSSNQFDTLIDPMESVSMQKKPTTKSFFKSLRSKSSENSNLNKTSLNSLNDMLNYASIVQKDLNSNITVDSQLNSEKILYLNKLALNNNVKHTNLNFIDKDSSKTEKDINGIKIPNIPSISIILKNIENIQMDLIDVSDNLDNKIKSYENDKININNNLSTLYSNLNQLNDKFNVYQKILNDDENKSDTDTDSN